MTPQDESGARRQALRVQATLLVAMVIWGLNVPAVKVLVRWFDPLLLASVRMVVASIVLTAIVLWKRCSLRVISGRAWVALGACGVLMVYFNQFLFAEGLLRSTATNASLIMALSPLVSALIAALAFGEALTAQRIAGVLLGLAGVGAVVLSHPGAGVSRASLGDLMLASGVVSFAAGGAIVQRLAQRVHPLAISWAIYVIGTVLLVLHRAGSGAPLGLAIVFPGWHPWTLVLFSGVLATAVSNLVWNDAIARIGVARTAVFLYWVPVFGVAFAGLFLGEQLTAWHLAGFAAVMGGTYLGTRRSGPRTPRPTGWSKAR
jgi:drug/metabolite transporter (DMT)-like permease